MKKHVIVNKKVWIAISKPDTDQNYTLVADQQHCSKCEQFKWVIGGITQDCNGQLVTMCPECLQTENKVCETRYCPYCNKNAPVEMQACKTCIESVVQCTDELYNICTVAEPGSPKCKCIYCKILERIH